jgi:hypothetical protein
MSNPDLTKILFSTRYKYFLNKSVETGTTSITAQSTPAFEAKTYTVTIPVDNVENYTQVKINFSHDPNDWYIFPCLDVALGTDFKISITGSYSASALTLTFYVVNQTAGALNSPTSDITVKAYIFETPA